MNWQAVVEKTVTGLGYELVGCERSAGGLLRVFIDKPWVPGQDPTEPVNVDDCERVTRQLQYVLEVENCDYQRLEVSSPGLDRPLTKPVDYERFVGEQVEITLRQPFQGRKKYRGELAAGVADAQGEATPWRVIFNDGKEDQALDFALDEVRSAKLVPMVSFKRAPQGQPGGKGAKDTGKAAKASKTSKKKSNAKSRQAADEPAAAQDDKVDGGLDQ